MNENIVLTKILRDCPKGTKLYSTIFGDVEFCYIDESDAYPIKLKVEGGCDGSVTADGKQYVEYGGECTLFPSKDQRDWSKFKVSKPKFDPKTLKPFDKVLIRTNSNTNWEPDFFGYINGNWVMCVATENVQCVPYNDDTKHLIGTKQDAPDYYRYWED